MDTHHIDGLLKTVAVEEELCDLYLYIRHLRACHSAKPETAAALDMILTHIENRARTMRRLYPDFFQKVSAGGE